MNVSFQRIQPKRRRCLHFTHIFTIPKGLRNKAQGCLPSEVLLTKEGEATLGNMRRKLFNPNGVVASGGARDGTHISNCISSTRCVQFFRHPRGSICTVFARRWWQCQVAPTRVRAPLLLTT